MSIIKNSCINLEEAPSTQAIIKQSICQEINNNFKLDEKINLKSN